MNHEYSVLGGINRAKVGQLIGSISAGVSSVLVAVMLAASDLAHKLGVSEYVPTVLLPFVGAGIVFTVLYYLFDKHVWKLSFLAKALRVPNLAGRWRCQGQTINPNKTKG